ncbi:PilN domain-containing protein [Motilimonas pumila]|uniref:T2SS protein L n=1 Tax=Motilimonas pumila TaxID=2303987 RepID=A0A418YDV8_9GAMM|nr:PilN domain-containing protein [Motilimonas pumila]RJG42730.1 hypothetical protein D1Z90_11610 [Motilimonas pumila]
MKFSLQSTYFCRLAANGKVVDVPQSVKPFDRVIMLIPQSCLLYKELEYDLEYVSRAELDECVDNDLKQVTPWPHYNKYFLSQKSADKWLVKVWIWPQVEQEIVTHQIPEMAFHLGCMKPGSLYCWKDGELEFASLRQTNGLPSQVWALHQPHQLRRFLSWLQQAPDIEGIYLDGVELPETVSQPIISSKKAMAEFSWLKAGQKENAIDISSPWGLKKLWTSCAVLFLVWSLATFGLFYWQTTQLEYSAQSDSMQLQQLQRQRSELNTFVSTVDAVIIERARQQRFKYIMQSLSDELPKDIVLTRINYSYDKVELEGTSNNTNGLLELLESMPRVASATFTSDIVSTKSGKQRFAVELTLQQGEVDDV